MSGARACPSCGGVTTRLLVGRDWNRRVSDAEFELRRCEACGFIALADPPADLAPYYTSDYHFRPTRADELDPHLAGQRFKIELLRTYVPGGALMEIGPSIGMFCRLAQQAGFEVSAIEMDAECARFLSEALGVRAIRSNAPAEALRAEGRRYDAICLWHALEHLPDPWSVVAAAADSLNPGGVLLIAVPNPEAAQIRWFGRRWPHYDLPRHLSHMTMSWLVREAGKNGLSTELMTTRDEGSLYWTRFSWALRLRQLSPHRRLQGVLWRAGMALGALLAPIEAGEGRGAAYTAVFRKPA
jgi:2-polyprenyl-3-methyl-5-hydroxy-6-metoxy-1,4-benzoquinol methylase